MSTATIWGQATQPGLLKQYPISSLYAFHTLFPHNSLGKHSYSSGKKMDGKR
jgi:hypothetical protein